MTKSVLYILMAGLIVVGAFLLLRRPATAPTSQRNFVPPVPSRPGGASTISEITGLLEAGNTIFSNVTRHYGSSGSAGGSGEYKDLPIPGFGQDV